MNRKEASQVGLLDGALVIGSEMVIVYIADDDWALFQRHLAEFGVVAMETGASYDGNTNLFAVVYLHEATEEELALLADRGRLPDEYR